jgi:hypothetical protein
MRKVNIDVLRFEARICCAQQNVVPEMNDRIEIHARNKISCGYERAKTQLFYC